MPARRAVDDPAAELERLRLMRNARQRRWRQGKRVDATNVASTGNVDATPPAPASLPSPQRTTPPRPPTGGTPRAVPKPSKSADVIDGLRAAGVPDVLSPRDHAAVKKSALSASQIVEAFAAACRKEWGSAWLWENLSVNLVLDRYAAYQASKAPRRRPQPSSSAPPIPPLFSEPLERIDPLMASRALSEAKRLTLPEKLALVTNGRHK